MLYSCGNPQDGVNSGLINFCNLENQSDIDACFSATLQQAAVPRIKNCAHPKRSKYRRVIRRVGKNGKIYYEGIDPWDEGDELTFDEPPQYSSNTVPQISINVAETSVEFQKAHNREGGGFLPLLSPISESQVSSKSSERIRALQAALGGEAFAERHGKPPPMEAPFYKSGADKEATGTEAPVSIYPPSVVGVGVTVR